MIEKLLTDLALLGAAWAVRKLMALLFARLRTAGMSLL